MNLRAINYIVNKKEATLILEAHQHPRKILTEWSPNLVPKFGSQGFHKNLEHAAWTGLQEQMTQLVSIPTAFRNIICCNVLLVCWWFRLDDWLTWEVEWNSMQGRCIVTRRYYELFKTTPESLETNVLHCVSTNFVSCRGNKTNMTQMTASDHQLHEWRQLFVMFHSLTWSVPDSWWA